MKRLVGTLVATENFL